MSSIQLFNENCYLKVVVFFVNLREFHGVKRFLRSIIKLYILMSNVILCMIYELRAKNVYLYYKG